MEYSEEIIKNINNLFGENLFPASIDFRKKLIDYINVLITKNFEQLLFLLYRIDINEEKLKKTLQNTKGENAAETIADMIIDRELKKIETRKLFSNFKKENFKDDELW